MLPTRNTGDKSPSSKQIPKRKSLWARHLTMRQRMASGDIPSTTIGDQDGDDSDDLDNGHVQDDINKLHQGLDRYSSAVVVRSLARSMVRRASYSPSDLDLVNGEEFAALSPSSSQLSSSSSLNSPEEDNTADNRRKSSLPPMLGLGDSSNSLMSDDDYEDLNCRTEDVMLQEEDQDDFNTDDTLSGLNGQFRSHPPPTLMRSNAGKDSSTFLSLPINNKKAPTTRRAGNLDELRLFHEQEAANLRAGGRESMMIPGGAGGRRVGGNQLSYSINIKNFLKRKSKENTENDAKVFEQKMVLKQMTNALRATDFRQSHFNRNTKSEGFYQKYFVVSPDSFAKFLWDIALLILVCYNVIAIPFDIAFMENYISPLDSLIDAIFLTDVLVWFRTGFYENHLLIKDSKLMAQKYLSKWFVVEFISSFPFEIILPFTVTSAPRIMVFLRTLRLGRIGRIVRFMDLAPEALRGGVWRIIRLFVMLLLLTHWVGCAFYTLVTMQESITVDVQWHNRMSLADASVITRYTAALYAGVLIMVGDDVGPSTDMERLISVFGTLTGTGLFAILFGQVALLIQNLNKTENAFTQRLEVAESIMRQMNLPPTFRQRVQELYEYRWNINKCQSSLDFLADLSPTLASEALLYFHMAILTAPVFSGTSADFLISLISDAQSRIFLTSDYIIKEGEDSREIFFVQRGSCEIIHGRKIIGHKSGEDMMFGEIGVLTGMKRTASVKAETHCMVTAIDRKVLRDVFRKFPEGALQVYTNVLDANKYKYGNKSEASETNNTLVKYIKYYEKATRKQAEAGGRNRESETVCGLVDNEATGDRVSSVADLKNSAAAQPTTNTEHRPVGIAAIVRAAVKENAKVQENEKARNAILSLATSTLDSASIAALAKQLSEASKGSSSSSSTSTTTTSSK